MKAEKSTFKVLFFLRKDRANESGLVPIKCRITINGENTSFNIHQNINPNLWDYKANKTTGKSEKVKELNFILDEIKSNLYQRYNEILLKGNYVTPEKVKNAFLGKSEDNQTLLQIFLKHNEDFESLVGINKSKGTHEKYVRTYTLVKDFLKKKYNLHDINIKELNHQFVSDFDIYLRTVHLHQANTVAKNMTLLKKIIILARNNGWIQHNPFINYQIKKEKVVRVCLSEDEIKILVSKRFAIKRLEQVQDLFLFSCYTDLSYIDVVNLKYEDIYKGIDGELWILKKRIKTSSQITVPLMRIPLEIIEKYRNKRGEYVLPVIAKTMFHYSLGLYLHYFIQLNIYLHFSFLSDSPNNSTLRE